MGRGEAAGSSHEAFYWRIAPSGAPSPDEDERERYLYRQACMLDERDRRSANGQFTIGLSWGMNLGKAETASERARQLEEILQADEECVSAVACADPAAGTILAFALISGENWWQARKRSEGLTERARKLWHPGRGVSLHLPTPYPPATATADQ